MFGGVTTPLNELYGHIARYGWEVKKLKWDTKRNAFTAIGKNQYGEEVEKWGPDDKTALANLLVAIARHTHMRTAAQHKVGMWRTTFTDQLQPIAEAYAKAPIYDPKAAGYFKELADDSVRRAHVLGQQLHIEVTDNPEPYPNAQAMADDIHKNKHFIVSRANSAHPVWSVDQVVAFRTVHDVLGHAVSGGDFGWQGENLACGAHFPMLTVTAQQALFTECIAQSAYVVFYRSYGPNKVCLFPQFTDPAMAKENPAAHQGIHPSQSIAPTKMPMIAPSTPSNEVTPYPEGYIAPHQEALGLTPLMSSTQIQKYAATLTDPNADWESGFDPLTMGQHGVGAAYLDHGDPLQADAVMDNAALIDTKWSQAKKGNGAPDKATMKQAIVNAFRVVLLSPRKDLRWNAVHYQDIAHVPADTDDPKTYWDTLERKRRAWNEKQGIDPEAHMIYYQFLKPFRSIMYQMHPELGPEGAAAKAKEVLFDWWTEEQQRIESEDADRPADKQRGADEIERRANEALAKRMKQYINDKTNVKTDVQTHEPMSLFSALSEHYIDEMAEKIKDALEPDELPAGRVDQLMRLYALLALTKGKETSLEDVHDAWATWTAESDDEHKSLIPFNELGKKIQKMDKPYMEAIRKCAASNQYNLLTGEEASKYGAFMGTHLKSISQISQHADELLDAALTDVRDHDGAGHHFRAATLALGISGVGPKVCSFAWLLLQPLTSQLGTIDTHMMDVLGHDYTKAMNNRDYFKFERQLAAGRDASGYSHVPLGAFQWGMWDHKRTGPGSHQDHSAMRVLDPVPHQDIDWVGKAQNLKGESWLEQAPDWWRNTQAARDAVGADWDNNVAPGVPRDSIPYQVTQDTLTSNVHVASGESKDEFHIGLNLPEELFRKLNAISADLDIKHDDPEDYHMTVFWSEHGWQDQDNHKWIAQNSFDGLRFTNARIDHFPSHKDDNEWAVIMRFDPSPEANKWAKDLMDQAEERGLEIKRFPGPWKAHITLGWSKEKVKTDKFPELEFRAGPVYVSIPRPLRKGTHPTTFDRLGAIETRMQRARKMYPGLSTPEIWKLLQDEGDDASGYTIEGDPTQQSGGSEAQGFAVV